MTRPTDFFRSGDEEPHSKRRAEILKKYPEIKTLMGYEWRTKYLVFATVSLQLFMCWLTVEWRWLPYLLAVYVVGATANHSLFLAIHELAHNLGATTLAANRLISSVANMPILFPYYMPFKAYHLEHHKYQGVDGIDTDIPTRLEAWLITTSAFGPMDHTFRKALFMFWQILAYALRPMCVKAPNMAFDHWLVFSWVAQFSFNYALYLWLGIPGLMYMLASSVLAGSIHPTAGHFLSEHYVTDGVAETYSYYGPLNWLTYNVGYHNEHHDFPNVPWSRLPRVYQIAKEYYEPLPQCKSWPGIIFQYIFDDNISPFSRVKRQTKQA